jgi:three-Cys-motif partner protein
MPGKPKKTDDEFFDGSLTFFCDEGNRLAKINPTIVDEYRDHSLKKLIAISYWIGIFAPIVHNKLKRIGYEVVYVDSMGGTGLTKSLRAGDCFCGSCPAALITAHRKGYPFDEIIAVEKDSKKAATLEKRLYSINPRPKITVYPGDIQEVSPQINDQLKSKTVSYIVIDPEGFKGLTWSAIEPLLQCKGDAMITWFENDLVRMREAALSGAASAEGNASRISELLGTDEWIHTSTAQEMTDIFTQRIMSTFNKGGFQSITISDKQKDHYKMLLFVGKSPQAQALADKWAENMNRRLESLKGRSISSLLDVRSGRTTTLNGFG